MLVLGWIHRMSVNQIKSMSYVSHQDYFDVNFEKQVNAFIGVYDPSNYNTCVNNIEMFNILSNTTIVVTNIVNTVFFKSRVSNL